MNISISKELFAAVKDAAKKINASTRKIPLEGAFNGYVIKIFEKEDKNNAYFITSFEKQELGITDDKEDKISLIGSLL